MKSYTNESKSNLTWAVGHQLLNFALLFPHLASIYLSSQPVFPFISSSFQLLGPPFFLQDDILVMSLLDRLYFM